jgi:hypothetical protein
VFPFNQYRLCWRSLRAWAPAVDIVSYAQRLLALQLAQSLLLPAASIAAQQRCCPYLVAAHPPLLLLLLPPAELMDLRQKFEEGRRRLAALKAARNFRPS